MLHCNLRVKITSEKKGIFSHFMHKIGTKNFSESYFHYNRLKVSIKGLVIKYGGGAAAEIGGGSSIFKLTKRGGSPKYWSCL